VAIELKPKKNAKPKPGKLTDMMLQELDNLFIYGFTHRGKQMHIFPSMAELHEELCHRWGAEMVPSRAALSSLAEGRTLPLRRADYREQLKQAERAKRISEMSERGANFDNECLKVAEIGINHIKAHFAASIQRKQPVEIGNLERMSKALHKFQLVGRMALGDTSDDLLNKLNTSSVDLDNLSKDELAELNKMMTKATKEAQKFMSGMVSSEESSEEESDEDKVDELVEQLEQEDQE